MWRNSCWSDNSITSRELFKYDDSISEYLMRIITMYFRSSYFYFDDDISIGNMNKRI